MARFIARGIAPDEIEFFAHGTTITTNALLEMRGAKVGLLITKGYRAVQEVQNQARDGNLFDYFYREAGADRAAKPDPGNPRALRLCRQRARCRSTTTRCAQAARELKDAGVESIAVCYLFSFMNPAHEEETRTLILEEFPGVHVSLSSEVLPRIREWPRLSTTLLNAYLEPVMVRYIDHLNSGLDAAGVAHAAALPDAVERRRDAVLGGDRRRPHRAHAVLRPRRGRAGQRLSRRARTRAGPRHPRHGRHQLRHRLHRRRRAARSRPRASIARRQIDVPALDMTTISAGGGSIAWIDGGGFLNVGPQSAGADPGPACYGRGGAQPTVTDADLVCGYLNPDYFLGGTQKLDVAASRAALESAHRRAAARWTCSAAAAGIQRIVDMRMADEVRVFAAKRGVDLSAFTLLPFGGAGAVHAAAVADELGMRRILVPPRPGAFSALGLLCTDVVHDYIRSELRPLAEITADHAEDIFRQLEAQGARRARRRGHGRRRCALRARARPALHRPGLRTAHAARRPVRRSADRCGARRGAGAVRRAPRRRSTATRPRSGRSKW